MWFAESISKRMWGLFKTLCVLSRYAWFSLVQDANDNDTNANGPNALFFGAGNGTFLSGLGKIYTEQLCPSNFA